MNALCRTVFSVGPHSFDWADVVVAGHSWGRWTDLEHEVGEGLACQQLAESAGETLTSDEIEDAAREFRDERDLASAEEAEAWLAERDVSVPDLFEYLERRLMRSRLAARLGDMAGRDAADPEALERVIVHAGFLSGLLERLAVDLAGRAALAVEGGALDERDDAATGIASPSAIVGLACLPPQAFARKVLRFARVESHHERLAREGGAPDAIESVIRDHQLEWMQAEFARLRFTDVGAAREAQMCLGVDGEDVAAVAAAARVGIEEVRAYLDSLAPAAAERLLSASPGEPLGPFESEGAFEILVLMSKHPPSAAEPETGKRAEAHLLAHREEAAMHRSVRWEWRT
jgi:hypothetical protein